MKIVLRKPLTYTMREKKGETPEKTETVNEIEMNFEALTGKDVLDAYREVRKQEPISTISAGLSMEFQTVIASRAAKLPMEAIMQLNAQDFTTAIIEAQNFMLGGDTKL